MTEYIEREAAYEDFEKCNSENPKWTPNRVKTLIARQKAADVAPVRHWQWNRPYISWFLPIKIKNPHCFCTNCAYPMKHKRVTRYCPNCGAKMDLEV